MLQIMAIKINIRGIDIVVSTAAEAAAVVREFTEQPTSKIGRPKLRFRSRNTEVNGSDEENIILGFLTTITNAGPRGVMADDLMKVLHVEHPKGVGGRSARINTQLKKLGFKPDDVYTTFRKAEGRVWKPRGKISEAIEALKTRNRG